MPSVAFSCHCLPVAELASLHACCLPWKGQPVLGLPLQNRRRTQFAKKRQSQPKSLHAKLARQTPSLRTRQTYRPLSHMYRPSHYRGTLRHPILLLGAVSEAQVLQFGTVCQKNTTRWQTSTKSTSSWMFLKWVNMARSLEKCCVGLRPFISSTPFARVCSGGSGTRSTCSCFFDDVASILIPFVPLSHHQPMQPCHPHPVILISFHRNTTT